MEHNPFRGVGGMLTSGFPIIIIKIFKAKWDIQSYCKVWHTFYAVQCINIPSIVFPLYPQHAAIAPLGGVIVSRLIQFSCLAIHVCVCYYKVLHYDSMPLNVYYGAHIIVKFVCFYVKSS